MSGDQSETATLDTLRDKLIAIEAAYVRMPKDARSPENLRKLAADLIDAVQRSVDPTGQFGAFTNMITEALQMAKDGKSHPLFAKNDDADRVKPSLRISAMQGVAAAVLEYACTDHQFNQGEWAKKIARTLGRHGLRQFSHNYSPDAIIKWRNGCKAGKHKGSQHYLSTLGNLRTSHRSPDVALDCAASFCQEELGLVYGQAHSGFADSDEN